MRILIDTNIFARAAQPAHPQHRAALAALKTINSQGLFIFFRDERAVFPKWEKLAAQHQVKGKTTHDARLVAAMLRHGLKHLLTFNASDFARYTEIVVFTPDQVLHASPTPPGLEPP
jgi:predicted nucleic acid-binding protein